MVQNLQYFAFWNFIIRPPRAKYGKEALGPADFIFDGGKGKRRDVEIKTKRGSKVQCSHFLPAGRGLNPIPVVIYLHGNASNRMEAWDVVVPFLKKGVSLFCFDAAGCGISEGEYISCGWHESRDLVDIIAYLRKSPFCGPIAIWGWSMGAVTALLYAESDDTITAMCLESPFASLRRVCEDLATSGTHIGIQLPNWLVEPVYSIVRAQVRSLAFFDTDEVIPANCACNVRTPAIFITRKDDSFIRPQHMVDILASYAGDKQHLVLEGDHSCTRSAEDIQRVVDFFCRSFVPHSLAAELLTGCSGKHVTFAPDRMQEEPIYMSQRIPWRQPEEYELAPVGREPTRSMPRCLDSSGLDFPEPKPLHTFDTGSTETELLPPMR
eukprot:CAMPEP_0169385640 /NCGR_PEP_ID=MMETSP1017-20121227/44207_1 /TAXON_ID=342587 /ORGANISM="Karlodinium micrum, Strain CCMP2283" /LENGTH=380 /DNA_ID=CAMNT_0009486555 /DNA_START=63 /DNA_END=1201 /DNA_ORIENTATION=-